MSVVSDAICCYINSDTCQEGVVEVQVYTELGEEFQDLCGDDPDPVDTLVFSGRAIFDPRPSKPRRKNLKARTTHETVEYDVAFYFCPADFVPEECQYIVCGTTRYDIEYVEVAKNPEPITALAYANICS